MVGCPFLHVTIQGNFALRRDLLLSTVTKAGKNTGRNLRFLHFRARYNMYKIVSVCRTITGDCLFRFVKGSSLHQRRLPLTRCGKVIFVFTVRWGEGTPPHTILP